jgi:hypothetical protein
MSNTPAFLTLSEYARRCGVTTCCTGWRRRGHIVLVDGKVDVVRSDGLLAARPSISRGGKTKVRPGLPPVETRTELSVEQSGVAGDHASWSRQEALRQREIAQARLAQIEADIAVGLLVPKSDILGLVRGEYTTVRTALLGMASKLAHRLAAEPTPEGCGRIVDAEVRSIMAELVADSAK